ncbi:MAG: carboxypeptidase M32 [Thermoproteota archaeon]|mgnify:CR=1 FL=1|nr:MAG: carboxypeptidase M32 [Candidatus Korarchaeota archaeon]
MAIIVTPEIKEIVKRYREIWTIRYSRSLLGWDMETYMPPAAFKERGEVNAVLESMVRRLITNPEFSSLVESAKPQNDVEKGIIRVLKRDLKYYTALPEEFLQEEERVKTEAFTIWREAKEKGNFSLFAPLLEKIVDLQRRKAEYLGYKDHPYDALLDLYEEGLTVRKCEHIFSTISKISHLFEKIKEKYPEKHPLEGMEYNRRFLERLIEYILFTMGFDFSRGRIDVSPHPFTTNMGLYDVRITTRYEGRDFRRALMAAIHEFGHAMYEMNIDKELWATPVQQGVSLGIHESQSRFWENIVGRSSHFIDAFYKEMVVALPFLKDYGKDDLYTYLTLVRPEFIRVEADEVQYVLHIYLRYKIEKELIEGSLEVKEAPQTWDDLMEDLIGVRPPNDKLGILQDIHWAHATIGYFPTYAIGSMVAAHIYREIKGIAEGVKRADFGSIMNILREKIHRWGSVYSPEELLERAAGKKLDPENFIAYLEMKYLRF